MKPHFFTKRKIIAGSVILAVILLSAGFVFAAVKWQQIKYDPASLFNQTPEPLPTEEEQPTEEPTPTPVQQTSAAATTGTPPAPTKSLSPEELLKKQADMSALKDTINVLLIGTDYADDRVGAKSGQDYANKVDFNSDVMIVLAINFKQKKVNMISCQRDTYAYINGAPGIYKLNSALSRGGGMNDKGYMNVCKSVQYLLDDKGRIPINYYIAGSIPAVKELVDMIGGIDFTLDFSFNVAGRAYKASSKPQHLNGQAVLDYCRVRKSEGVGYCPPGEQGDDRRTGRQREILMTVFEQLKASAKWYNVPTYLAKMSGKVATNLPLDKLAAIVLWAKDLPKNNITSRMMPGVATQTFGWSFVLINQSKRVQLIRDVYGINVDREYKYDENYARLLWAYMQGEGWIKSIKDVIAKDAALKENRKLTPEQLTLLDALLDEVNGVMSKYRGRLYNSSKPTVGSGDVRDLETAIYKLHDPSNGTGPLKVYTLPDDTFYKAGYTNAKSKIKVNWKSHIYVPHQNE